MKKIIFHITPQENPYTGMLKSIVVGRFQTLIDNTIPTLGSEFVIKSKQTGGADIISTSAKLLSLVLPAEETNPSIHEYAGSLITFMGVNFLFVPPLDMLVKTNTGKFILSRFLEKYLRPEQWIPIPPFKWELFEPARLEYLVRFFDQCTLVSIDIETRRNDPERVITCIGFSGVYLHHGSLEMITVVVPMDCEYNIQVVRLFCSSPTPKVLQNGKYDIAYLLRYGAPVSNYAFDTLNLFHCWYSELPKDLGFISAFMVREYIYHKNEGKNGNVMEYYEYNAKDVFYTALTCLALFIEIPEYAIKNYQLEFPITFPCILSEHTGFKWDSDKAVVLKEKINKEMDVEKKKLQIMLNSPAYNPNSPQQTVKVFAMLGSKDVTHTTPSDKDRVASRHPLNEKIVTSITNYRKNSKLRGSYFKDSIPWLGRCFYSLNPAATDTGRLASKESQFWCGLQIQNIPRDPEDEGETSVKECFLADDGFLIGEADRAQAETRDTAYLSGDPKLIEIVEDERVDFHGKNASEFFGIPYEDIVDSHFDEELDYWVHKTLQPGLRYTAKRTNHGATYNMGAQVLLDTMGIKRVLYAKKLLKLPDSWELLKVTGFLLHRFEATYSVMKGDYYNRIIKDVRDSSLLVGPTGWTRRCFGAPWKNKLDLNSYVAHPSQSLNAMELNVAYLRVFKEVWIPNPLDFKLCAQIHDSILFQYREGREDLAWEVVRCMDNPIPVKDIFGVTRILRIPVDLKGNAKRWSDVKTLRKKKERAA